MLHDLAIAVGLGGLALLMFTLVVIAFSIGESMPTKLYTSPGQRIRAIILPHGGGKTEEAVAMLRKDDGLCLFVQSQPRQHQLEQEYPHLKGRVFSNPTTIPTTFRGIVIDNIEDFLPALPKPLVAFTMTGNT